jgi:hypothetical protein
MNIARPDIAAVWPETKPRQRYGLKTASEKSLPILQEALVELALGRSVMDI